MLYGSNLVRIPPEIGAMTSLEEFTPYTSYRLHWVPYEITRRAAPAGQRVFGAVRGRTTPATRELRPVRPHRRPGQSIRASPYGTSRTGPSSPYD